MDRDPAFFDMYSQHSPTTTWNTIGYYSIFRLGESLTSSGGVVAASLQSEVSGRPQLFLVMTNVKSDIRAAKLYCAR